MKFVLMMACCEGMVDQWKGSAGGIEMGSSGYGGPIPRSHCDRTQSESRQQADRQLVGKPAGKPVGKPAGKSVGKPVGKPVRKSVAPSDLCNPGTYTMGSSPFSLPTHLGCRGFQLAFRTSFGGYRLKNDREKHPCISRWHHLPSLSRTSWGAINWGKGRWLVSSD